MEEDRENLYPTDESFYWNLPCMSLIVDKVRPSSKAGETRFSPSDVVEINPAAVLPTVFHHSMGWTCVLKFFCVLGEQN